MSFSSDNEAVYSGDKAGLAVRWKSHFDNHAFLHLLDRAHKIEALHRYVINHTGPFQWAYSLLHCTIKQVVDTMTSKTMCSARQIDAEFTQLHRMVATRFIAFSVRALDSKLNQYGAIVSVLEDKHSDSSTPNDKKLMCLNTLKVLLDEKFILSALILSRTLELGAHVSLQSQADNYSIWDDAHVVERFKEGLLCLEKSPQANTLIQKHKDDILSGRFQGIDFAVTKARVLSHGRSTRSVTQDDPDSLQAHIEWAYEQQSNLAGALLDACSELLAVSPHVRMLRSIFILSEYPRERDALNTFRNHEFVSAMEHYRTKSPLSLPSHHVTALCDGLDDCQCALNQFRMFKTRVCDQIDLRAEWYADEGGTNVLNNALVLQDFLKPARNLHRDIPDVVELLEIALLMCPSQSDTERTGKVVKNMCDDRFGGKFTEIKDADRDRCAKEVFTRSFGDNIEDLPMHIVLKHWYQKGHHGVLKKRSQLLPSYINKPVHSKVAFIGSMKKIVEQGTVEDESHDRTPANTRAWKITARTRKNIRGKSVTGCGSKRHTGVEGIVVSAECGRTTSAPTINTEYEDPKDTDGDQVLGGIDGEASDPFIPESGVSLHSVLAPRSARLQASMGSVASVPSAGKPKIQRPITSFFRKKDPNPSKDHAPVLLQSATATVSGVKNRNEVSLIANLVRHSRSPQVSSLILITLPRTTLIQLRGAHQLDAVTFRTKVVLVVLLQRKAVVFSSCLINRKDTSTRPTTAI